MSQETITAIAGAIVAICALLSTFFSRRAAVTASAAVAKVDAVKDDVAVLNVNVDGKLQALLELKDRLLASAELAALLQGRIEGHAEAAAGVPADDGTAAAEAAGKVAVSAAAAKAASDANVAATKAEVKALKEDKP